MRGQKQISTDESEAEKNENVDLGAQSYALGVSLGLGIAALILVPATLFGHGFFQSLLPVVLAIGIMTVGAIKAGRPLARPPFFATFTVLILSGMVGNWLIGVFDGLTAVNLLSMIVIWFLAGNLTPNERVVASKIFIAAAVLCGLVVCAETLLANRALIAPVTSRYLNPLIGTVRGQGTLGQPLVASFVFTVALILLVRLDVRRAWRLIGIGVLLLATICTGSSSGLVIAAAYLVYVALVSGPIWWRVEVFLVASIAVLFSLTTDLWATVVGDLSLTSNTHRLNSILAIPNLIGERPSVEVLIGSGWNSVTRLYDSDIFANDRFYAIDNQFVSIFAFGGIVATGCFLAVIFASVLRRAHPQYLAAFVSIVASSLSFDFIVWPVTCSLFVFTSSALLATRLQTYVPTTSKTTPADPRLEMHGGG